MVNKNAPVPVSGGHQFASLSVGEVNACGLTAAGRAWCWGAAGTRGNGGLGDPLAPVEVAGGRTYKKLIAGGQGGCAITTADQPFCWGGVPITTGSAANGSFPWVVAGGHTFTGFAPTQRHVCGLTSSTAYCWGLNDFGQIGDSTRVSKLVPTAPRGAIVFTSLATGGWHSCGLTAQGAAYCWGSNNFGEIGSGILTQGSSLTPVPVRSP